MSDRPSPPSTQREIAGRCERIIDLRDEGWTFQRIGAELGVTTARAAELHQLAIRDRERRQAETAREMATLDTPFAHLGLGPISPLPSRSRTFARSQAVSPRNLQARPFDTST